MRLVQSYIDFIKNYRVVFKLIRFFYLLGSFLFGSFIGLKYLSLILSLRVMRNGKKLFGRELSGCPKKRSRVKVIQSVSHPQMSDIFRGGQ